MNDEIKTAPRNPIAALRRFTRPRAAQERCDLCSAIIGEEHQHLLEPANRQLHCACDACAVLFSETTKYRRVPRRIEQWRDFQITDEQWEALGVPIALAFFFFSTPLQQMVTMYPSPGGATEATLANEVWQILCDDNPQLAKLEPDVEALLVNRIRGAREYYRVPIDECFKLVGLIRTHWRGLSGGAQVWKEIEQFFQQLKSRSTGASTHA
jgi:hypothetical protein